MATRHLQRLVAERRTEIEQIARAHGVTRIRLVGPVARGDDVTTSDIDFLVRFEPGRSLSDQAGLTATSASMTSPKSPSMRACTPTT